MKFWLLTSMFMLTAVGYASVSAPCHKIAAVDLAGHIQRTVPVAAVAERSAKADYTLFAGAEVAAGTSEDGTAIGPSQPTVGPAAPIKTPEVSPGNGTDQSGKSAGDQATADPTKNYLIYFTATWCGPCRIQKPVIEEIQAAGKHKVHIVDIDQDRASANAWGISSVPVVCVVRDGKVVYRGNGAGHSREFLEGKLEGK